MWIIEGTSEDSMCASKSNSERSSSANDVSSAAVPRSPSRSKRTRPGVTISPASHEIAALARSRIFCTG